MVIAINPLLSQIFYILGYSIGGIAFVLMARHRRLYTPGVLGLLPIALIAGLLGGTILQVVVAGSEGKSILGALVAGYAAIYFYKKKIGLTRPLGDIFAVALAAGEAVGRLGCLFAGCCYGKSTTASALTIFQHGAYRYPTQIYLAIASALILDILLVVEKRRILPENGLFCLYGVLYCSFRFGIEFYRFGSPFIGLLTIAQLACIGGLLYYALYFIRLVRHQANYAPALS